MVSGARAAGTNAAYDRAFKVFEEFCGVKGVSALPAAPATLADFLLELQRRDAVHGSSLRVYTAAIRAAHLLNGLTPPAEEQPVIQQQIRGFQRLTESRAHKLQRVPFTTEAAVKVTQYGLVALLKGDEQAALAAAAIIFQFVFLVRSVTACNQQIRHINVEAGRVMRVRLSLEKGKAAASRTLLFSPPQSQFYPDPFELLTGAVEIAARRGHIYWFGGEQPLSKYALSTWWREVPRAAGCSEPSEGRWMSHSARSGGASAALNAGIQDSVVQQRGGWKSSRAMLGYVYEVQRHPADRLFFG